MTKYCIRLAFLAAAAFSLIHGCSDGSLECLGNAVACGDRDVDTCNHGCEVESGCLGDSEITCDSLTNNPDLCLQTPGCRYVGSCDGGPGCNQIADFAQCGTTPGCTQVRRCFGGSISCDSLDDSQCELYSQCVLGSRCVGSADSCGNLESAGSCLDVPGCYSADTKPSVVGFSGAGL
jgi:hypothetical protein